jgi:hypothetical protein
MTTYAINLNTNATTEYDGFAPNSMCLAHDGNRYMLDAAGLHRIGGGDDNGAPIEAMIGLGKTDLGSPYKKRLVAAYLEVSSETPMLLRLFDDDADYELVARSSSEVLEQQRVDLPRGVRANFFGFELYNTNGGDFTLDNMELLSAASKTRRIG